MFLRTLTHAQTLCEMQNTFAKTWKLQGEVQQWYHFLFGSSREQSRGVMKRQEDDRIKVSEPEPDKREEKKRLKRGKCRTLFGGSHCDTLLPHRRQRWSSTFLCLREFGGKVPHSHPSCNTHTHTHLSNRTWLLSLLQHVSTRNKQRLLPLHSLLLSFTPPLSFFLRSVSAKAFARRSANPDTHTCAPLSRCLSPSPSLSFSPRTRTEWRPAKLYTRRNLLSDPPPVLLHLCLSFYISLIFEYLSTMPTTPHPKNKSMLRGNLNPLKLLLTCD